MTNWKWDYNSGKEIEENIVESYLKDGGFGIFSGPNIVDDILNEQSYIIWEEWFRGMTPLDRVKVWEK